MVVLLPVGSLLVTSNQVLNGSRFRAAAETVAQTDLTQLQAAASQDPGALPPTSLGAAAVAADLQAPTNPTTWASALHLDTTIGAEVYRQYLDGDWCVAKSNGSTSSASWAASSTAAGSTYVVAVKVVWGPAASTSGASTGTGSSVVVTGAIPPQSMWPVLTPTDAPATDCPAGLA